MAERARGPCAKARESIGPKHNQRRQQKPGSGTFSVTFAPLLGSKEVDAMKAHIKNLPGSPSRVIQNLIILRKRWQEPYWPQPSQRFAVGIPHSCCAFLPEISP